MNPILRQLLTALIVLIGFSGYSQTPVQVTPQLIPPYSLQVSEYYGGAQPKLQVLLLNRDINQPSIQVRLRMNIESQNCRMRTKDNAVTPTFTLTSGVPYYLTPQELQVFFAPANIDFSGGYNEQEYVQTGRLPEGLYTFSFEAFELYTGNLVSNKGFTMGWLTLADPPLLNTPAKAEGVTPGTPQNIIFNWTPRHNTSPTAGYYTDYIISIAEYNDINVSPDASFTSSPPLFIDSVQTTTYLYGSTKPQLVPGKRYAWRVQAKAKNGAQQLAMFRNNGFSEVYWFTYQNICPAPVGISATAQGQRVTIQWQANMQHMVYKVEYREKNNPDAQWFSLNNTRPSVTLVDIKPATQYEYRVGGSCQQDVFTFGSLYTFTSNAANVNTVVNCGDSTLPSAGGGPTLQTLVAGDTLRAGSFTVHVGHSTGTGSFTGMGYVIVPWLMNAKVEVKFTGITLSLDRKLLTGVIETTYDPSESGIDDLDEYVDIFAAGYGLGGVVTGEVTADTTFSFTIAQPNGITVQLPSGYNPQTGTGTGGPVSITVTPAPGSSGGTAPITYTVPQLPTTLMDKDGNIYQVNKQGQVVPIGNKGGDAILKQTNKKHVDIDKAVVKFVPYDDPKVQFAFDEWKEIYKKNNLWNKEYERLDGDYYVSAKAIAPGETDYLKAIVTITDTLVKPDSIQFVNGKGTIYKKTRIETGQPGYRYEIAIVGGPERDAQEIYALYPQGANKTLNLGKVLVASYPRKVYKIRLVPVNGVTVDLNKIKDSVTKAFSKLNFDMQFEQKPNFVNAEWDADGDGLDVKGSSGLSQYTGEMKALADAYKFTNTVEPDAFYLFVLNNAADSTVMGDMPRGKQFGFLFVNGNPNIGNYAAHEIGHGVFKLKHLSEYNGFTQTSIPDNLLAYPPGLQTAKHQWDLMHDPPVMGGIFDADEDSKSSYKLALPTKFCNYDSTYTLITHSGRYITLPKTATDIRFDYGAVSINNRGPVFGTLQEFRIGSIVYKSILTSGGQNEQYVGTSGALYENINRTDSSVIMGLPFSDGYKIFRVKAIGLTRYTHTGTNPVITSESQFTVVPFSANNPLTKPGDIEQKYEIGEECNFCYNTMVKRFMVGHDYTTRQMTVAKIAYLARLYPELFYKFSRDFDDWSTRRNTLKNIVSFLFAVNPAIPITEVKPVFDERFYDNYNGIKDLYTSDTLAFYYRFLAEYKSFIVDAYDRRMNFLQNLDKDSDRDSLITYLEECSVFELRDLSAEKKLISLDIIASECMRERTEKLAVKLLRSQRMQPVEGGGFIYKQADSLLQGLTSKSRKLSKPLLMYLLGKDGDIDWGCGIDDETLFKGSDMYKAFVTAVIENCYSSQMFWNKVRAIQNELETTPSSVSKYIVDSKYTSFWKRFGNAVLASSPLTSSFAKTRVQSTSTLKYILPDSVYVRFQNKKTVDGVTWFKCPEVQEYGVFDPVIIVNSSSLPMTYGLGYNDLSEVQDKISTKNAKDILCLPALVVEYIDDKQDDEITSDVVTTLIDVATIWTGYGAFAKALTWSRRAFVVADMTGAGISLTGNFVGDYTNNPTLKKVATYMSAVCGVFSLGQLTRQFSTADELMEFMKNNQKVLKEQEMVGLVEELNRVSLSELGQLSKNEHDLIRKTLTEFEAIGEARKSTSFVSQVRQAAQKMTQAVPISYANINVIEGAINTGDALGKSLVPLHKEGKLLMKAVPGTDDFTVYARTVDAQGQAVEDVIGMYKKQNGTYTFIKEAGGAPPSTTKADIVAIVEDGARSLDCKGGLCGFVEGGCVGEGTPVFTKRGTIPAEKVVKGDYVQSYDTATGKMTWGKVLQTSTRGFGKLYYIYAGKSSIAITPEHPVFADHAYREAELVKKGMLLKGIDNKEYRVDSVVVKIEPATVYNYTVENTHNYFAGIQGMLVHNSAGACYAKRYPELVQDLGAPKFNEMVEYFVANNMQDALNRLGKLEDQINPKAWEIFRQYGKTTMMNNIDELVDLSKDLARYTRFDELLLADQRFFDFWNDVRSKATEIARKDYAYEKYAEILDNLGDFRSFANFLEYEGNKARFLGWVEDGRKFGDNVVRQWASGSGRGIFGDIVQQYGKKTGAANNVDAVIGDYTLFTEVHLVTSGDEFMKADALLVKFDEAGAIEDIILIENKLSGTTDFTVRQRAGLKKIWTSGTIDLKTTAQEKIIRDGKAVPKPGGKSLNPAIPGQSTLSISKDRIIKVADGGNPDTIVGIGDASKINVTW